MLVFSKTLSHLVYGEPRPPLMKERGDKVLLGLFYGYENAISQIDVASIMKIELVAVRIECPAIIAMYVSSWKSGMQYREAPGGED